jgi:TolA-binding protein
VWVGTTFAAPIDEYNLALQLYKQERWDLAAERLRTFLEQAPGDEKAPLAQLYLGQALVHQRKFGEARPIFRDFAKAQPQHQDIALATYRVAECSYFLGDFAAARGEFQEFLRRVPAEHALTEWAMQYLGETELRLGEAASAARTFQRAIDRDPKGRLRDEAQFGLARSYERLDRADEAVEIYRRLAANPQGSRAADAQFHLAARLFERRDFAESAAAFTAIARNFPEHELVPLATLNAGFSQYHLRQYAEAIAHFEQVKDHQEYGPRARYWIGLSYKSSGELSRGGDLLLAEFEKNPGQPLAESMLFHAASCRLGEKRYDEARRQFADVVARWPQGELADDALHLAVESALLAGDLQEAESLHRQFDQQFPGSGLQLPSDLVWGRILLARGDAQAQPGTAESIELAKQSYREANAVFQRILANSQVPQTQGLARLQLARSWERLENWPRVLETVEPLLKELRAESVTEEQLRALLMKSRALLSTKSYVPAEAAAGQYLALRPRGDDAREAWGDLALARGHQQNWTGAVEALQSLADLGDSAASHRVTYELAELAYQQGLWTQAAQWFESLSGAEGAADYTLSAVSGWAYSLHEQAKAEEARSRELTAQGEKFDAASKLAGALRLHEMAATQFGRLTELARQKPDQVLESNAVFMRGLSLRLARNLEAAVRVFRDGAEKFRLPADVARPSDAQRELARNAARCGREAGRALAELGQVDEADEAYELAYAQFQVLPADQQSELDRLVHEWALVNYNAERYDRSDALFRKLLEVRPQSPLADDVRLLLAESDFFADRFEPAREAFRALADDSRTDPEVRERALLLLIDACHRLEDWEQLGTAAQRLQADFPQSEHAPYASYRNGEALLQQQQPAEARKLLEAVLTTRENPAVRDAEWFPGVWLLLAETDLQLKDYAGVDEVVATFKQTFPDAPLAYHLDDVAGRRLKNEARFPEAREAFQRVIDSPHGRGTETAAKAQFFIAETWLTEANSLKADRARAAPKYEEAFLAYYRVLLYDFPDWQAPALFMAGQCEEALHRWSGAVKSYQQLIDDFPQSKYAADARRRLDDLERRFPGPSSS